MPYKDKEVEKVYYPIGEVAAIFGVNTSLIRFWEKEFDIIRPKKNKKGNRLFTKADLENFQIIFDLVKKQGYTLEGAKQKLKESVGNLPKNDQIYEKLEGLKTKLLELYKRL
jgi:DNA-binding transcriptional MerR regulator